MKSLFFRLCALSLCVILGLICAGCVVQQPPQSYTLEMNPDLSSSRYTLGDTMGDYTVTDVNGVSHSFSEILDTKKAIVLNFWFINCGPCQMEFPYMNEAYEAYKDKLEILAINPVGDSETDIKAFAEEFGLSFPMAAGDIAWESAFALQGYPTTVVIDQTGTVSFVHTGYIDSTETFEAIFEFFTKGGYTPTLIENLSDIK